MSRTFSTTGVFGELEVLHSMRLHPKARQIRTMAVCDSRSLPRLETGTPVRAVDRHRLQRLSDHFLDLRVRDRSGAPSRLVAQPFQPAHEKRPHYRHVAGHLQLLSGSTVIQSLGNTPARCVHA